MSAPAVASKFTIARLLSRRAASAAGHLDHLDPSIRPKFRRDTKFSMHGLQSRSVRTSRRILAKTLSAGYCSFVIKICIIYQVLVILMLRIVSLEKFGPGVTNPF